MTKVDSDLSLRAVLQENPWNAEVDCYPWQAWVAQKSQPLEAIVPQQCGILLEFAVKAEESPVQQRVDEIEETNDNPFSVPFLDQQFPFDDADPIEEDPPIVDERLCESEAFRLLIAERHEERFRLIFFGYDGLTTEKREAETRILSVESVLSKVQQSWQDRPNVFLVPFLAVPQPEEFATEGIVFLVIIQDPNLGMNVIRREEIATLTAIRMSIRSICSTEPPLVVFRGSSMPRRVRKQDIVLTHELQNICQPTGRRPSEAIVQGSNLEMTSERLISDGAFIRVEVGAESFLPQVRASFAAFDQLRTQLLDLLQQSPNVGVRLVTFGHRFVFLGQREHSFVIDQSWTPDMLADQNFPHVAFSTNRSSKDFPNSNNWPLWWSSTFRGASHSQFWLAARQCYCFSSRSHFAATIHFGRTWTTQPTFLEDRIRRRRLAKWTPRR